MSLYHFKTSFYFDEFIGNYLFCIRPFGGNILAFTDDSLFEIDPKTNSVTTSLNLGGAVNDVVVLKDSLIAVGIGRYLRIMDSEYQEVETVEIPVDIVTIEKVRNTIWVGTKRGLWRWNMQDKSLNHPFYWPLVNDIMTDRTGNVFLCTSGREFLKYTSDLNMVAKEFLLWKDWTKGIEMFRDWQLIFR